MGGGRCKRKGLSSHTPSPLTHTLSSSFVKTSHYLENFLLISKHSSLIPTIVRLFGVILSHAVLNFLSSPFLPLDRRLIHTRPCPWILFQGRVLPGYISSETKYGVDRKKYHLTTTMSLALLPFHLCSARQA